MLNYLHMARFMESLRWVDQTYVQKHKKDDPAQLRAMYYPNMRNYQIHGNTATQKTPREALMIFLTRYARRGGISLAVYFSSYLPYVGRFVLPAASFYTFNKAVGPQPAIIIFGSSIFLPKRYLIHFLQSYFASRSLMRELVSRLDTLLYLTTQLTVHPSSSPTSPGFVSPKSRRRHGSVTAKESFSALASASSCSSRFPYSVFSFMELLKRQLLSWSPKSRILHRHQSNGKSLPKARRIGTTSTSF